MAEPVVKPLKVKITLSDAMQQKPQFAIQASLPSGDKEFFVDPKATRALVALMDMEAVIGGAASHYGGPAAFAELMSAIYGLTFIEARKQNKKWFEVHHIVNDAGHCENGIYALRANYALAGLRVADLKKFRSIESPLTGHGEAHVYPEGVYISNGPLGSGLPQAQGLAAADALAGLDRVTITAISDGACFEGEAKEAFAAIPGLAKKGKLAPFVCVISDNNTKLSGRIDQDAFSLEPSFAALETLGWKYFELKNGNDLQACVTTIYEAIAWAKKNPTRPAVVHARTIKGIGTEKTVKSSSGGHGFPISNPAEVLAFVEEIYQGTDLPGEMKAWADELVKRTSVPSTSSEPTEKVQVGVSAALIAQKKAGLPLVSVTSDLPGSTGLAGFHKAFPESCFDVGVAESNMVSMAIGLSKAGYIPVVDTFAQFGVTKGALPLIMSSLSEGPMICVFSHVGFQDAADGASHQALSYFSMLSAIPHVEVYNLTSSEEAYALVSQGVQKFAEQRNAGKVPHTLVYFLGRENFKKSFLPTDYSYQLGEAQIIFDNSDQHSSSVCIAAGGALLPQALLAAQRLTEMNLGCVVVNPSVINRPDVKTFAVALAKTNGRLLTVEDHQKTCGMGAMLVQALAEVGCLKQVKCLGVQNQFGQSAYQAVELYRKHGLDAEAIAQASKALCSA